MVDNYKFGLLIQDSLRLKTQSNSLSFQCIHKSANKTPHNLRKQNPHYTIYIYIKQLFPTPSLFSLLFTFHFSLSLSLSCFTILINSSPMALPALKLPLFFLSLLLTTFSVADGASWCVARSDASNQALQTALDYACASGADCTPLQSDGLCFLPNTIQAHASYAFNSYYQRRAMAPGSCDFAGTATVAKTDPSFLSYEISSTAGGLPTPTTPTTVTNNPTAPTTTTTAPLGGAGGSNGLNNPGLTPPFPTTDESRASFDSIVNTSSMSLMLLVVLSFILHSVWIF
ncbi:hypothetical protein GOBAR_AA03143 [Gossypium barbadense]|uniref:X8 domain-containing protein n=1 Tax=Gossypium barbadense TaxID=3634 RepID=A0A2P5YPC7_GOSBA|nr:hypothetical protein GOBAR_AA03143 [Gossypium barbadense]